MVKAFPFVCTIVFAYVLSLHLNVWFLIAAIIQYYDCRYNYLSSFLDTSLLMLYAVKADVHGLAIDTALAEYAWSGIREERIFVMKSKTRISTSSLVSQSCITRFHLIQSSVVCANIPLSLLQDHQKIPVPQTPMHINMRRLFVYPIH